MNVGHVVYGGIHFHPPAARSPRRNGTAHPARTTWHAAVRSALTGLARACDRAAVALAQICRYVVESDLVVADVSGGNPDVMDELGLRHITGKPTIHIGEAGQLPFDIASVRTIRYQRTRSHLAGARKEIESALEAGLRDGFELLTPARVLRGLHTGDGPASVSEVGDGGQAEDEDSPGLLDGFAVIEDGLDEMAADMEAITKTVEAIGVLTEQSGTEMLDLAQANAPMSARLAAVARYAETISAPAGELNAVAAAFAERMTTPDSGTRAATPPRGRGRTGSGQSGPS